MFIGVLFALIDVKLAEPLKILKTSNSSPGINISLHVKNYPKYLVRLSL
jgi:hypothetical protein